MNTFPNWSRSRLECVAREHALDRAIERDDDLGDPPVDRLVVNMLRHEFSDYDEVATAERHAAICRAIATSFPWLATESERQIERRALAEQEAADMLGMAERWDRERRQ
jgi:hypothetical protein